MFKELAEGLKPCPFCGSTRVYDAGLWHHVIKCLDCGTRSAPCSKWNEAVSSWNTRALTPAQERADELLDALGYVLTQLRLAYMGFFSTSIDAVKLQELFDSIAGEYGGDEE